MSDAIIGFGTQIKRGNGATPEVFEEIDEIVGDIDGPSKALSGSVDVTPHKRTDFFREKKPGLIDPGEISFKMNYVMGSTSQANLEADFDARAVRNWQIVLPDDTTGQFTGFVSEFGRSVPEEDKITLSAKIMISGAIEWV